MVVVLFFIGGDYKTQNYLILTIHSRKIISIYLMRNFKKIVCKSNTYSNESIESAIVSEIVLMDYKNN
jgi:hypothetical protein